MMKQFYLPAQGTRLAQLFKAVLSIILLACLFNGSAAWGATLVADHEAADHYNDIPQYYIDLVKTMWVTVPGESHSSGYRIGCNLLQAADSRFQVNVQESGTPESYTDQHLRFSRATWGDLGSATGWRYGYGEEDWYTSTTAINRTMVGIGYCAGQGNTLAATGFGWCWDMTWQNSPGGTVDPVYAVRWAGSSEGGPDGSLRWGLDAGDQTLTGNSVCMDTYLDATRSYINYCTTNNLSTRVFFTTGPVDGGGNTGENGYQRSIKHNYIRAAVNAETNAILFDYADILCWSNAGVEATTTWTDGNSVVHTYQVIHSDNMLDLDGSYAEDGDHIGERGALRLAKAMWWMLARMAGWDGLPENVTPTVTPTESPNYTMTASPTLTSTRTSTRTPTPSPTSTHTSTTSATRTASPSSTSTATHSPTATATPVFSSTFTPTVTASVTITPILSATASPTSTLTISLDASRTFTPSAIATRTVTATCTQEAIVGQNQVRVYPNPAHDQMTFFVPTDQAADVVIMIYNVNGERVAELVESTNTTAQQLVWNCGQVAPGIYFARVKVNGSEKAKLKVMVTRK